MDKRSLLFLLAILALACAGLTLWLHGADAGVVPTSADTAEPAVQEVAEPLDQPDRDPASARSAPRIGAPRAPQRAPLAEGEARIAGWLHARDDKPWRDASVALLDCSGGGAPVLLGQSRCEPDGGFAVAAAHAGRVQFVVLARGFVPRNQALELIPGEEQMLEDVELERGVAIGGALSSNAHPVPRFEVVAIDERELPLVQCEGGEITWNGTSFEWRFTTAESGADGRYSIGGLHAGDYSVRISTCRGPLASLCAGERPARTVRAPRDDADFAFESSALALQFRSGGEPLADVEVELTAGSWRSGKRSDAHGEAAFTLVPRLDCRLVATKPGYEALRLPVSAPASGASSTEQFEMRAKGPEPEVHFVVSDPHGEAPTQMRVRLFALPESPQTTALVRDLQCTPASATQPVKEFVLADVPPGPYRALAFPGQPWNFEYEVCAYIGTHCASEFLFTMPAQGELRQSVTAERRAALRLEFPDGKEHYAFANCTLRDANGVELPIVLIDPALGRPLNGHTLSQIGPTLLYTTSCIGSALLQVDSEGRTLFNGGCEFRPGQVTPVTSAR